MKHLTAIVAVLALVTAGCSRPAPVETEIAADMDAWQPVDPLDMTDTQEAQHELVLAATNALASEMMGELTAALDAGDPAAAIASSSRMEPPGWITAAIPAAAALSMPSRNGKKASEAMTAPAIGRPASSAFQRPILAESTRLIWPAPTPTVRPSAA